MANGEKMRDMEIDPIVKLERSLKFEESKKSAEPKVIEMLNSTSSHGEPDVKKSTTGFSFLGSQDQQQEMIKEFLERNKKKPAENKTKDPVDLEPKVTEIKEDNSNPEPIVEEPVVAEKEIIEQPKVNVDSTPVKESDEPKVNENNSEEKAEIIKDEEPAAEEEDNKLDNKAEVEDVEEAADLTTDNKEELDTSKDKQ